VRTLVVVAADHVGTLQAGFGERVVVHIIGRDDLIEVRRVVAGICRIVAFRPFIGPRQ